MAGARVSEGSVSGIESPAPGTAESPAFPPATMLGESVSCRIIAHRVSEGSVSGTESPAPLTADPRAFFPVKRLGESVSCHLIAHHFPPPTPGRVICARVCEGSVSGIESATPGTAESRAFSPATMLGESVSCRIIAQHFPTPTGGRLCPARGSVKAQYLVSSVPHVAPPSHGRFRPRRCLARAFHVTS